MAFLQIDYKSEALMRGVNIKVILPSDGMAGKWEPPYKTLYLLPGYSATATELITYLGLRGQSELKGIAIVLPDGENLFYQDLPDRMTFYSTYVGKELVEVTRKMLPLSTKREDTFIGGISMGGYGALYNGFKYRDTFSKVVAFSPAADACMLLAGSEAPGFSRAQFEGIFGNREAYYGSECDMCTQWTRKDVDKIFDIDSISDMEEEYEKLPYLWSTSYSTRAFCYQVAVAKGINPKEFNGELLYKMAEEGDPVVLDMLENFYFTTAKYLFNIFAIVDPDIILLGGGISAQPAFVEGVKRYVEKLKSISMITNFIKVDVCKFGNDSNLLGALYSFRQMYLEN